MSEWLRHALAQPWVQKLLGLKDLVVEEGAELDLTWSALPPPWVIFILIIPAVAVAWFLIYRHERKDAGTVPKIMMGLCRVLVVLMVIVMLFGPTITVEARRERKAFVLVLIDESLSMGKADRPRLPEDQALVARAVYEQVPETLTPDQIEYVRSLTRLDVVQAALRNPRLRFIEELKKKMNVAFFSFSGKIKVRDEDEIFKLTPIGAETAVGEAISLAMAEKRGSTVLWAIVFTDGRNNAGQDPEAVAKHLGSRYVSVYTVAPGVERKPMDLRLLDLEAPEAAIAADNVTVKYRLEAEGYADESVRVGIYMHPLMDGMEVASTYAEARRRAEGLSSLADETIRLEGDEIERQKEFSITPRKPDFYELILITDVLAGESTEENNFLAQRFQVADEKITVLYVDHWPRWEFRFLKNALIRDTKIKAHMLQTSADPTHTQDKSPGLEPLMEFPRTLKELVHYDVLIIGDVPLVKIGGVKAAEMVATFASEFGGGIVFLAGTDSNPAGFRDTPLEKVLPVVLHDPAAPPSSANPFERDLPYRLTDLGEQEQITRLIADPEQNRKLWNNGDDQLPGLPHVRYYVPVKRVKANAQVLAHLKDPAEEQPVPLFVTMFYGRGRIFFSATDETYRWRWLRGDYPYFYPFWQHVMYWARKGKLLGLHRLRVSVEPDRCTVGETVTIRCNAYDQNMEPLSAAEFPHIEVTIEPPSGEDRIVRELPVDDSERQGFYRDTFQPTDVGEYRVWAGDETGLDHDVARFSVFIPNREEENPIIDEGKLKKIAAASHASEHERTARAGRENFYPIDQLDQLARSIQGHDTMLRETHEDDLWDAPLVYLLFALLITAEWILRKIYRMI